jgi:iron complex transport system ATP-binding protein
VTPLTPILDFDQVTFGYRPGGTPVLDDFCLTITSGTATVVLGPNGVGKSTLLHLAHGWLKPRSGCIRLDGVPLPEFPRRALGRTVALVPQSERTPFAYSLLDFVQLARAPHLAPLAMPGPADEQIARDALDTVGLSQLRRRPVTTLSGGEHQLGLVARALAQQPRLLLMDEPTAHLDLAHKARLINLIRDLRADGMTIVASTHEPDVAAAIASHVVLVRQGRVHQAGPRSQVFTAGHLSTVYGVPIQIVDVAGREVVLWT